MNDRHWIYPFTLVILSGLWALTCAHAEAPPVTNFPSCPALPPYPLPGAAPETTPPGQAPGAEAAGQAAANTAAQQSEAGTQPSGSYAPNMLGDLLASQTNAPIFATLPNGQTIFLQRGTFANLPTGTVLNVDAVASNGTIIPAGTPIPGPIHQVVPFGPSATTVGTAAALLGRGTFKISENESPRPVDRVFINYNYFNRVLNQFTLNRETLGAEKTFLDGNASVGVRVPFFQLGSNDVGEGGQSDIGDISVIFKYALLNDADTGNVLSTGVVVTAPTGPTLDLPGVPTDIHPWLLQPWVGAIYNFGNGYLHGFSSVVIPTDSRDATLWFNDIGLGYYLYRCEGERFLTAIVPTVELHFNDPLSHRGSNNFPIGVSDVFDVTGGVTFGLGKCSTLALGLVAPFTGPRPYDYEIQAQLNYHF